MMQAPTWGIATIGKKAAKGTADGTEKAVKKAGDAVEKAKDVVKH